MRTHPYAFLSYLAGAASRQEWIDKITEVEDLAYSVLQVPDLLLSSCVLRGAQ